MTPDQMIEFAKMVADGGTFKKSEVVEFCKALVAETPEQPALVPIPKGLVKLTETGGVHVSSEAVRTFSRSEAISLAAEIDRLARS